MWTVCTSIRKLFENQIIVNLIERYAFCLNLYFVRSFSLFLCCYLFSCSFLILCKLKTVKLAASVAMNSYHPYGDISSPHPPSPDNNNYASSMSIGNTGGHHHNGHAQLIHGGQQQGFHQINNNNAMMNKCAGCGSKYHYHQHISIRLFSNIVFFSRIIMRNHLNLVCVSLRNDWKIFCIS